LQCYNGACLPVDAAAQDDVLQRDASVQPDTKTDTPAQTDAPRPDAQLPDAPRPDTQAPDAPQPDTQPPDAPQPDTQPPDAPQPDKQLPDAPQPDQQLPDTQAPDKQQPDTAPWPCTTDGGVSGLICGGTCVDTQTSNLHCKTCNNTCGPGSICVGGSCVPDPCVAWSAWTCTLKASPKGCEATCGSRKLFCPEGSGLACDCAVGGGSPTFCGTVPPYPVTCSACQQAWQKGCCKP
jgi:hypothetical protein